jgi:hypothetical protein
VSWYLGVRAARARTETQRELPARRAGGEGLLRHLRASVGRRVTLLWRCGAGVASTTGWILKADADAVEVRGAVPTYAEPGRPWRPGRPPVRPLELNTVIPTPSVCALVEGVPRGRRAAVALQLPGPAGAVALLRAVLPPPAGGAAAGDARRVRLAPGA